MSRESSELAENVLTVAHRDVETLRASLTISQAIDTIRSRGLGEKIVYFYVTDDDDRLCGVLPARSLLTESPEKKALRCHADARRHRPGIRDGSGGVRILRNAPLSLGTGCG